MATATADPSDDIVALHIRAYPHNSDYAPLANEAVIPKRWTKLVLSWE